MRADRKQELEIKIEIANENFKKSNGLRCLPLACVPCVQAHQGEEEWNNKL